MPEPAAGRSCYTCDEYLAFDRQSQTRHEFVDGVIYALRGADRVRLTGPLSRQLPATVSAERAARVHGQLVGNVLLKLRADLADNARGALVNSAPVRFGDADASLYPDVVVACGDIRFADEELDTLLTPTVIVEVLSPTTEAYDRGAKFAHYRRLPSLQHYVLVAQDRVAVEVFTREGDGWLFADAADLTGTAHLAAIGYDLALADVYDRVQFPFADEPSDDEPLPPT